MRRVITILLLLISTLISYAQTDTLFADSPFDFYPLNIGDVRHYKITDYHIHIGTEFRYFSEKVLKDTVINDLIYKKIKIQYSNSSIKYSYERIDSLSFIVYHGSIYSGEFYEFKRFHLNAQEGLYYDNYECSFQFKSIFGYITEVKLFSYRGNEEYRHKYIATNFGSILETYDGGDMSSITELKYTEINGIEYGSPIPELDSLGNQDNIPEDNGSNEESNLNDYVLYQNYPNPFNSSTKISFNLPSAVHVKLEIYNMLGKQLQVLIDEKMMEGKHTVEFDGANLSSGIYLYRLKTDKSSQIRKMIYLR
jgi:hypothetical protein